MMKKMSKTYAGGGKMKAKGMKKGGKLEMVEKDGKMVPFFAADGEGKMKAGGMTPKTKGYFKGGKTLNEGGRVRGTAGRKRKPRGRSLLEQKMDAIPSGRAKFPGKKPPQA